MCNRFSALRTNRTVQSQTRAADGMVWNLGTINPVRILYFGRSQLDGRTTAPLASYLRVGFRLSGTGGRPRGGGHVGLLAAAGRRRT